jgi:cell division protease FtsH
MALGVTQQLPSEEKHNYTKEQLESRIAVCMGGRIAEDLTFKEISTGAANDIEQATEMARKMVCEWGMSEHLGPITYGKKEEQVFLGKEFNRHQDYSEATALKIDSEIKRIVSEQYDRAQKTLTDNKQLLQRVAEALLELEVLDAEQLRALIEGRPLEIRQPSATPPPATPARDAKVDEGERTGGLMPPLPTPKPSTS